MFEMNHFKSIDELVKFFPTEQSCIDFWRGRDGVIMSCLRTIQTQRFINARETDTSARIREVFQRPDKHDLREHESVAEEMDVGLLYRHKR